MNLFAEAFSFDGIAQYKANGAAATSPSSTSIDIGP